MVSTTTAIIVQAKAVGAISLASASGDTPICGRVSANVTAHSKGAAIHQAYTSPIAPPLTPHRNAIGMMIAPLRLVIR